jgi:pantoate--beta-alanine ligase
MSSRNVYLSASQRAAAPVIHRSLRAAVEAVAAGERSVAAVEAIVADAIAAEPEAVLDYASLVDAATLDPATEVAGTQRLLVAARFGATRLLDNIATTA